MFEGLAINISEEWNEPDSKCFVLFLIHLFICYALLLKQHKFDDLVASFAGNQNAEFFGLTAELGPGFYILIVYSICAGFLHYIFFSAVSEYHHMDTHHKICFWWTKLFKCMLRDTRKAT